MTKEIETKNFTEALSNIKSKSTLGLEASHLIRDGREAVFEVISEHFKFDDIVEKIAKKFKLGLDTISPHYNPDNDSVHCEYSWSIPARTPGVTIGGKRRVTIELDFNDNLLSISGKERELVINVSPDVLQEESVEELVNSALHRSISKQI